ncbi:hypothetical protein [uncultured Rikenella sp.]|uniref:hypothetical protein n=1 Tax=uncultured Rikenella sp. TaxID=368003 RepID=UPI00262EBB1C|nr:hypothetical protein [uncultured Rikenella sp.]
MENEETLKIIRILVVAGVFLYAGWSMLKKKAGTTGGARTLRERGENFPFPEPENSAEKISEEPMINEGEGEEDRVWSADREGGGTMATGTGLIVAEEAAGEDSSSDRGEESGGEQEQVVTDLRTIVIANELLKPKYEEY